MLKIATATLALLLAMSALAQQPAENGTATATPLNAGVVPGLRIHWDCGTCTVNEKVIPLLLESYRLEAAKHNKTVSETHLVDARIHDYRQRNPGLRVMFGVMGGKDRLGLRLDFNGQEVEVRDYSANAIQGMNALCESVAKQAYAQITGTAKKRG